MLEPPALPRPNLTVDGIAINIASLPQAVDSIVSAAQSRRQLQRLHAQSRSCRSTAAARRFSRRLSPRPLCHRRWISDRGVESLVGNTDRANDGRRSRRTRLSAKRAREDCRFSSWFDGTNACDLGKTAVRTIQGIEGGGILCPRPRLRSLFRRSRPRHRKHSRFRRATLLRRAWRAAPGSVRRALPRRTGWNRHALHRRRPRFHRRQAKPRTVASRKSSVSNGRGGCCTSRAGWRPATRAAWPSFPAASHAPFRKSSTHASGKPHDLYTHPRAARPQRPSGRATRSVSFIPSIPAAKRSAVSRPTSATSSPFIPPIPICSSSAWIRVATSSSARFTI